MYKLYKGDSAKLLTNVESGSVDAIVTDPPYLYLNHKLDVPFDEDVIFKEWYRVLKDDGMLVVFGRGVSLARWIVKLNELGFKFLEEIVWVKNSPSGYMLPVIRKHEMAMIFTKGKGKLNKIRIDPLTIPPEQLNWDKLFKNLNTIKNNIKDPHTLKVINHYLKSGEVTYDAFTAQGNGASITGHKSTYATTNDKLRRFRTAFEGYVTSTVLEVGHNKNKHHPTQKPDRLMEILIRIVSDEGEVILDPFMGSGSTGVAAVNLNRNFIGMEIDDEYFNKASERLVDSTTKKEGGINNVKQRRIV